MDQPNDHVSFFLPCYQCAGTVEASVASILNGNLRTGDEIVMVDDGSGDGTWDVLQRLATAYSEIRLVRHSINRGGAAARNTAVRDARHDLLFCLDSDNLLAPGSVPRLLAHLKSQQAAVAAFGELWFFLETLPSVTHRWVFRDVVTMADCFAGGVVPPSSGNYLFTRASWERAGGYPENAGALDAWGFGLRQLAAGARMVTLAGTHYLHRYGHNSYWMRDHRDGRLSAAAARVVAPFFDHFPEETVRTMTEEPGCRDWFVSLDQQPLPLKVGVGRPGRIDKPFPKWWSRPFLRRALRGCA